ncbi:MAG: hypothetical protein HY960_05975 [Ignavibacteriae bacterium]|nr:hypothetical protein [Ignavibacteriota bacterium]
MRRNVRNNIFKITLFLILFCSLAVQAGDIKPSVELEFNIFYDKNYPQPFSFQMREAKLFLDANISEHSSGLIEYTMRDDLKRGELERLYFVQRDLPFNSQLTLGQFRSPFGYYDAFTVSHSLTKSAGVSPDGILPTFKLRSHDVGVLWEAQGEAISWGLAVVNGNGISGIRDDNNFKDVIGHALYAFERIQVGLNGFYGRKNSLNADGSVKEHSSVEVKALGIEAMGIFNKAVIAGEAIIQQYEAQQSQGAYVMMNYDLGEMLHTLRSVTRFEVFDPNTDVDSDERVQCAQGFRYTIDRGYTIKFEYIMNWEKVKQQFNELFVELEYEL